MSHPTSRKTFFAKLASAAAALVAAPGALAQPAPAAPATSPVIRLRPEGRAVARRADSL